MNLYALFGIVAALAGAFALLFKTNLNKATVEGLRENYNIIKDRCDLQDIQLKELQLKYDHCNEQHKQDQRQISMLKDMVSGTTAVKELRIELQTSFEEHDRKVEQGFRDLRMILRGGASGQQIN